MTLRTRFLITALVLCHQLLMPGLVTSQLLAQSSDQQTGFSGVPSKTSKENPGPCAKQAAQVQEKNIPTICAMQQEKLGDVYKLHGNTEIHYRNYVLRADEVTYDDNSGEANATGHFTLDGGPNDDHIKASHATYNLTAETGRFYDVTATTGLQF